MYTARFYSTDLIEGRVNTNTPSLLFHDYETFGTSPQKDLPCQFAAIRTDLALNIIGKPINITCQIANDYLPHPQACLVTGIIPQQTLRDGMIEAEFARKIHNFMSTPNTCVVGYNSIRFDDEVSRYLFYRNFFDPYAREWQNGNSRWDIIDLVRACYALRPEGINWPEREDGAPSFKLEDLTAANNLEHGQAHDALSDVYATIALAKLIRDKQPKLFSWFYSLRQKHTVLKQFNFNEPKALVHVSSRIPASQGGCTWVLPVGIHPLKPNSVIVVDLNKPLSPLLDNDADTIREMLYTPTAELEHGERPGLKLIHINRSPFIAPAKSLTEETAQRLGIDKELCTHNYKALVQNTALKEKIIDVYSNESHRAEDDLDADYALYSSGFLTNEEKSWCHRIQEAEPEQLGFLANEIQNPKLITQLFRYRARNFPHTLNDIEVQRWQAHRRARLTDPQSSASITLERYLFEIEKLAVQYQNDPERTAILRGLYQYAENL
ncbi:exodeoxyribonuclease I [Alteromonas sp. ASW11-130]|uniref:exodeoxyribonuclease I n=1 Tax=Alteromonas sp. ASW11-130 TaxID=3015775 RepID=UPI002242B4DF|nr:exodeoxyribonuclease I [Alteromonas sp. ASW11-130]MCW8091978.1 exodeoxyribonuclease I [Alteromonas sp. ASW11-130]